MAKTKAQTLIEIDYQNLFAAVMRLLGCAVVVIMGVFVAVLPCCVIVFWIIFAYKETEHPDSDPA